MNNKITIDFSEKRSEKRFPINSEVKITIKSSNKTITGRCMNISGSGLLISTDKAIGTDKEVLIDISEGKIEYGAEAAVVRCEETNGQFLIGIKVTNQIK